VLFPMLLDGNDVIIVIRNDLMYQSVQVYWTSNGLQFLFDLLANNTDGVIWIQVNAQLAITSFQVISTTNGLLILIIVLPNGSSITESASRRTFAVEYSLRLAEESRCTSREHSFPYSREQHRPNGSSIKGSDESPWMVVECWYAA
jgi:hypothetical protein